MSNLNFVTCCVFYCYTICQPVIESYIITAHWNIKYKQQEELVNPTITSYQILIPINLFLFQLNIERQNLPY